MIASTKAESFVGIIVGIFILSFVVIGIINVIIFSNRLIEKYDENNTIQVLRNNLTNVVRKMDTSTIKENEIFFIQKNTTTHIFSHTGSAGANYRYLDSQGNNILDPENYDGDIYIHALWLKNEDTTLLEDGKNQIIQASVKKLTKK